MKKLALNNEQIFELCQCKDAIKKYDTIMVDLSFKREIGCDNICTFPYIYIIYHKEFGFIEVDCFYENCIPEEYEVIEKINPVVEGKSIRGLYDKIQECKNKNRIKNLKKEM